MRQVIELFAAPLCLRVMIGVRADGRKELIALADGYRESAERHLSIRQVRGRWMHGESAS
jgi:hypothetical protein